MSKEAKAAGSFKQKAKHEATDFLFIALYLSFFFCALVTYTMLTLRKYDIDSFNYAFALINALVIAKVVLLGEMAHLGKRWEARPLYQSIVYKACIYGVLVFCFHLLEEFVKRLIHGEPAGTVWHHINFPELVSRAIVVLCAFLPLFAFRELRRVLGEETLHTILLSPRPYNSSAINPKSGDGE